MMSETEPVALIILTLTWYIPSKLMMFSITSKPTGIWRTAGFITESLSLIITIRVLGLFLEPEGLPLGFLVVFSWSISELPPHAWTWRRPRAPDSIKDAYCAVALDCTAKYLAGYPDAYGAQYLDAVDRIWRGRIQDVERSKASDLVSEQLRNRRLLVEAAV
ncbi:hypothetical protein Godav_015401 [Gossypium davidsonii]|uniref:Uncharacterized protein n=1 Tax=Gossypium davidsonii TaxID=34287 RepID=A0A7J8RNX4_GOSDV|nr:hypothetical protein [Gossypium davidsonii]